MAKKRVEILNRYTNACQWAGDIEDTGSARRNLGAAIKAALLTGAVLRGAVLRDADLTDADLTGAVLRDDVKISALRAMLGLYRYQTWAFTTDSGVPWVRMGCLWNSVEEWDRIGIRASNPNEFPDDGSAKCEERVRAFEFARDMALRMAEEWKIENQKKEG